MTRAARGRVVRFFLGQRRHTAAALDVDELDAQHPGEAARDAGGVERAMIDVQLLGPEVRAGPRVGELRVDPDGAAHPADAALERVATSQALFGPAPTCYFGPKTSMATRPALTAQGQPA